MKLVVSDSFNERLDKYIFECEDIDISRSKIQNLIKTGNVLVNGKEAKNSYIVNDGDEIDITMIDEEMHVEAEDIPINIVYEDDDVIVVNKQSGMVVHPGNGNHSGTLVNALMNHSKLSTINGEFRPGIVHRIDKDTSGLLVVAKNDKAHLVLAEEIKNKQVKRKYIALVKGVIQHDTGTIDAPIGRDKLDRKKMCVTPENSKEAITHFKVLERFKEATLLECILDTGRTHQIRVHMKYIGHPIINDPVYLGGKNIDNYCQMLHAYEITFIHPTTKEVMTFNAPLEDEFNKILDTYR